MSEGTPGKVLLAESVTDSENDISPYNGIDFVQLFPPELSKKLFSYLPDSDLLSCCACNSSWRETIDDNTLWKLMCKRRGWLSQNDVNDPFKWTRLQSHVADNQTFRFRPSPVFKYPMENDASPSPDPCCEWALYFRQCSHLANNWRKGICVIEEMKMPDEYPYVHITNDTSCNGKFLSAATNMGYVFLWSLEGVPELVRTIEPEERTLTIAVEAIQMSSDFLIVLYENKELKVFIFLPEDEIDPDETDETVCVKYFISEIKGVRTENPSEFVLECIDQELDPDPDLPRVRRRDDDEEAEREELNEWVQNFVDWNVDWFNTRGTYSASDLLLLTWENIIVVTGSDCKNILVYNMLEKRFVKSIGLPQNSKCCSKCFLSSSKIFISAKKVLIPGRVDHREVAAYYIFILSRDSNSFDATDCTEINSVSQIDEIHADEKSERVAYVSHQGAVSGFDLKTKDFLFLHQSNGNVDNLLVYGDYVLYHQFRGNIFGLNWAGEVLYDIEAHVGIVRGIRCVNEYIISAGDAMELNIWDLKTGTKVYNVYHQPCHIYYLHADETKIVTVGKEDPPVLIGFW